MIVEANRSLQRQHLQATPDYRLPPTALSAMNLCDQTANRLHVRLLPDLNDLRVACRQSRFQLHQAVEETGAVAMMINMAGLTDPRSKGFPAKDLQVIEAARERRRGTREILTGLNEVIVTTARGPGGLLLILAILVKSLAVPLAGNRWDHNKCPALKLRETTPAHHTSGNLYLRSRCLAPMVQGTSLASHPSVTLFLRSRCLPRTIHPTATEVWVHRPRNPSHRSNMTRELQPINKLRVLVLNL